MTDNVQHEAQFPASFKKWAAGVILFLTITMLTFGDDVYRNWSARGEHIKEILAWMKDLDKENNEAKSAAAKATEHALEVCLDRTQACEDFVALHRQMRLDNESLRLENKSLKRRVELLEQR